MRATSTASFDAASQRWEPVVTAAADRGLELGRQIYSTSDLLVGTPPLARALTDPSRSGEDKAALAERVLRGTVDEEVLELVEGMARARWSDPEDLPHALEILAVDSVLASAQEQDRLESVEDELFRIGRLLTRERGLRNALGDVDLPADRRVALVESLFGGRVSPETELFLERATVATSTRSVLSALHAIGDRAGERRELLVAAVIAAAPLTESQVRRLGDILERAYGRRVQVNVGVDERLVGGLRITVGSEVLDATVLARLEEVRTRLAG